MNSSWYTSWGVRIDRSRPSDRNAIADDAKVLAGEQHRPRSRSARRGLDHRTRSRRRRSRRTTEAPSLMMPAFSVATDSWVSPRNSVWSSRIEVMTATAPSAAFVASHVPPRDQPRRRPRQPRDPRTTRTRRRLTSSNQVRRALRSVRAGRTARSASRSRPRRSVRRSTGGAP